MLSPQLVVSFSTPNVKILVPIIIIGHVIIAAYVNTRMALKKITQMDDLFIIYQHIAFASSKEKPKASLTLLTAVTVFPSSIS